MITETIKTFNLTPEQIEHTARQWGEPHWHIERRLQAFERFTQLPIPTRKQEDWRYTDVSKLRLEDFVPAAWTGDLRGKPPAEMPAFLTENPALYVYHTPGFGFEAHMPTELKAKGVQVRELREVLKNEPERLQRDLGRLAPAPGDKFSVLHTAAWDSGLYIYIPANVVVDETLEIVHWIETPGAHFPHTLVLAEQSSAIKIVESFFSPEQASILCVGAIEVIAGANSSIQHTIVERMGRETVYITTTDYEQKRDSRVQSLAVALGGKLARNVLQHLMTEPGSEARPLGLYFGDSNQHLDFRTLQDHQVGRTSSDLLYKGALTDDAASVFSGFIKVHADAQGTDAYQANRNLLLSDGAKAHSIPNLEIGANEVRCTHGATIGPVMPDELFYLKSRGLSPEEAEALIVMGFFEQVLREIKNSDLRLSIQQLLASKLKGEAPKYFMDLAEAG